MKKQRAWALCAAWMVFIFLMSAAPASVSSQESGFVASILTDALKTVFSERMAHLRPQAIELYVRKAAHMAEYAVLFALYRRALTLSGARMPGPCALLLCAAYAATDEFHQFFVAGRSASPIDVLIDTAGAAACWCMTACLSGLRKRARARRPSSPRRRG